MKSDVKRHLLFIVLVVLFFPFASNAALPDFSELIEKTSPAVVKINTATRGGSASQLNLPEGMPEALRRYYEYYYGQQQDESPSLGLGSGFIISEDGYVITNNHVVEGATEVTVRLSDRREFDAEVVGLDERSDIALLKIDGQNLPTVEFATDQDLKVGEWVLAIGSPFDLEYSASAGIVSAIGRSLPRGDQAYVPFIQTDVAINPGNSGGPLFNLEGQVVGVNSQIYTRSGGFMGLSFAIPIELVAQVAEQLKATGSVSRGWLGVVFQDVDQRLATSFGLSSPRGALVSQVVPNSPADDAGLRPGDIILEVNDHRLLYSYELPQIIGSLVPGDEIRTRLLREGRERTVDVELGSLDSRGNVARASTSRGAPAVAGDRLGLVVDEISRAVAERTGHDTGVVLVEVAPGSAAEQAGLQAGDLVVQIGFTDINSVDDFEQAVAELRSGKIVPIRFYRGDNSIFRTIQVD